MYRSYKNIIVITFSFVLCNTQALFSMLPQTHSITIINKSKQEVMTDYYHITESSYGPPQIERLDPNTSTVHTIAPLPSTGLPLIALIIPGSKEGFQSIKTTDKAEYIINNNGKNLIDVTNQQKMLVARFTRNSY